MNDYRLKTFEKQSDRSILNKVVFHELMPSFTSHKIIYNLLAGKGLNDYQNDIRPFVKVR